MYFLNISQNFSNSKQPSFSVSGNFGRPARSTGDVSGHALFVHVRRSTEPVDRQRANCSRDVSVDRKKETVFPLFGRSTGPVDREPTALCCWAGGRPDRSTARPATSLTALSSLGSSENLFSFSALTDF